MACAVAAANAGNMVDVVARKRSLGAGNAGAVRVAELQLSIRPALVYWSSAPG